MGVIDCMFLNNTTQQHKRGLLVSAFGFFLRWSLALERTLSGQKRKFHLNHRYIFLHKHICIVGFLFLGKQLINDSLLLLQIDFLLFYPSSSVFIYPFLIKTPFLFLIFPVIFVLPYFLSIASLPKSLPQQWSLFTFLSSAVTLGYKVISKDLDPGVCDQIEQMMFVFPSLGYITQYYLFQLHLFISKFMISFFFRAEQYSMVYMNHVFIIHLLAEGYPFPVYYEWSSNDHG